MSPFDPARYTVKDGVVYKRNNHQQRIKIVRGPNAGNEGWLLRKNGSVQHVLLDNGVAVVADLITIMDL